MYVLSAVRRLEQLSDEEALEVAALDSERLVECSGVGAFAPLSEVVRRWRVADGHMLCITARDQGGQMAGLASVRASATDLLARVDVFVRPEDRRRGLGSGLLTAASAAAGVEGIDSLFATTSETVTAGEPFCAHAGAVATARRHIQGLRLDTVRRSDLASCTEAMPDDVDVVRWEGPTAPALIADLVDLMGHAFDIDAETMQAQERRTASLGIRERTIAARRTSDGRLIAYHDCSSDPLAPTVARIGGTAVDTAHRRRGLAAALKARMVLDLLDEGDIVEVRTEVADNNLPMLRLNETMGYRTLHVLTDWELQIDCA